MSIVWKADGVRYSCYSGLHGKVKYLFTSLAKGGYFLVVLVCLSVRLFVCGQHYLKSYEWIGMQFYGGVLGNTMENWLNFGGDLGLLR